MRKNVVQMLLFVAAAAGFAPAVAQAAPPLLPGEIIASGVSYAGPASPCADHVCRIDATTGAATSIGDPLPGAGFVRGLAAESATSILVLQSTGGLGTVSRLDVTSGTVSPVATGFQTRADLVVAPSGRIFVTGAFSVGILEVDPGGAGTTVFAAGVFEALAVERDGSLLTTRYVGCDPIFCQYMTYEFVRIDSDTAAQQPLGEFVTPGQPTTIAAHTSDLRVVYMQTTPAQDAYALRWTPAGQQGLFVDEGFNDMEFDYAGRLVVGGFDDFLTGIPEIQRWSVDPVQVVQSFEQGFGVGAIGVGPPACRDGLDNDGDGTIDWNGGPGGEAADAFCQAEPWRNREHDSGSCGLGAELVLLLALVRRRWS